MRESDPRVRLPEHGNRQTALTGHTWRVESRVAEATRRQQLCATKAARGFVHEVRCTRSSRSGTRRVRPKRWPRPPPERGGGRDNNKGRVVSTDTPTSMLPGISRKRKMRSKFWWFTGFCKSQDVSHFAAFFIVVGAKTSVAESFTTLRLRRRQSVETHARLLLSSDSEVSWVESLRFDSRLGATN